MTRTLRTLLIGSAIGLMNVAVTSTYLAGRPIGASTSYPYLMDRVLGWQRAGYFETIQTAGAWELWFLIGAVVGALAGALVFGRFAWRAVPDLWASLKGPSRGIRLAWAFAGGFILILGARLADGCTSGHILSGGMEMAVSSIVFALCVLVALLVSARLFYRRAV